MENKRDPMEVKSYIFFIHHKLLQLYSTGFLIPGHSLSSWIFISQNRRVQHAVESARVWSTGFMQTLKHCFPGLKNAFSRPVSSPGVEPQWILNLRPQKSQQKCQIQFFLTANIIIYYYYYCTSVINLQVKTETRTLDGDPAGSKISRTITLQIQDF